MFVLKDVLYTPASAVRKVCDSVSVLRIPRNIDISKGYSWKRLKRLPHEKIKCIASISLKYQTASGTYCFACTYTKQASL